MPYEVQMYTLCDGWINTWSVHHEDGSSQLQTFPTIEAAQAEIETFLAEIEAQIENGERQPDEGYDLDDFRIMKV